MWQLFRKSSTYFTWGTWNFVFLFQGSHFNSHSSLVGILCWLHQRDHDSQVTSTWSSSVWHSKLETCQQWFSHKSWVLFSFSKGELIGYSIYNLMDEFRKQKTDNMTFNQGSTKSKNLLIIAGSLPILWKVSKTQNWRFFWYEISSQNWTPRICDYENFQNFGTRGGLISKIW